MAMLVTVSKTDLARNTREIVERVRSGQTIIIKSYGEEQIVLLDALDYRIMKASVSYVVKSRKEVVESSDDVLNEVMFAYLGEQISLAKASELLGLSRFDLMERFERTGIPLRQGSDTLEEAIDEVSTAHHGKASA
jgi:prevent-host-death family protein